MSLLSLLLLLLPYSSQPFLIPQQCKRRIIFQQPVSAKYREDFDEKDVKYEESLSFQYNNDDDEDDDYDYDYGYDDYGYEDDAYEEKDFRRERSSPSSSNYWSNPNRGYDSTIPPSNNNTNNRRRRRTPPSAAEIRRRQSSYQKGVSNVPGFVKEFYNNLFWYGVDMEDSTDAGDKTIFGGTRGKFNGLKVIEDQQRRLEEGQFDNSKKLQQEEYYGDDYDYDDGYEEDYGDEDDILSRRAVSRKDRQQTQPPPPIRKEQPSPAKGRRTPMDRRRELMARRRKEEEPMFQQREEYKPTKALPPLRRRPRTEYYVNNDFDYVGNDFKQSRMYINREVSSWFDEDDEEYYREEYIQARKSPRWKQTKYEDEYKHEKEEDLTRSDGSRRPNASRSKDNRSRRKVVPIQEDLIVDVDVYTDEEEKSEECNDLDDYGDDVEEEQEVDYERYEYRERRRRKAKERGSDLDRIPPSGIKVWGKNGEVIGVDIRQKAALDAISKIEEAQGKVEKLEEEVSGNEEALSVISATARVQRRRLQQKKGYLSAREITELRVKLRKMDSKVLSTKRALTYVKNKAEDARYALEDLELEYQGLLNEYRKDIVASDDYQNTVTKIFNKSDNYEDAQSVQEDLAVNTEANDGDNPA